MVSSFMRFYFSGLSGKNDAFMLRQAGVHRVLVNPTKIHLVQGFHKVALDSNAYHYFRHGGTLDVISYMKVAVSGNYVWVSAPDVIGDPEATYQNWMIARQWLKQNFRKPPVRMVPVWGWGTPKKYLNYYLQCSRIVGIGGLVMLMRQGKSENLEERAIAYKMLRQLKVLCQQYPQRFHIYGCNWIVALNHLRGLSYSADSSLAWDGARYGLIIHIRNDKLIRTPAWKLGFKGNREARCIVCAKSIQRFMAQR
jgi:hypothetical protein